MSDQVITDLANKAVKELVNIQPHCDLLKGATFEVSVEDDTLAIVNFEGTDMYLEVHTKEYPAIGRTVLRPNYAPGYYKQHGGDYWNPPELEDVSLGGDYNTVTEALAQLVALDWMFMIESNLEAEAET